MLDAIRFFWAYNVKHKTARRLEWLTTWFVWHTPRYFVKWYAIRVMSDSTAFFSDRTPDQITIMDALNAWDQKSVQKQASGSRFKRQP